MQLLPNVQKELDELFTLINSKNGLNLIETKLAKLEKIQKDNYDPELLLGDKLLIIAYVGVGLLILISFFGFLS